MKSLEEIIVNMCLNNEGFDDLSSNLSIKNKNKMNISNVTFLRSFYLFIFFTSKDLISVNF